MPKFLNHLDLVKNQLQNALLQVLGADPTPAAGDGGYVWYNSTSHDVRHWDGTTVQKMTNVIEGVTGTAPIVAGAITAKSQAISITAASGAGAGSMSTAHYNLVNGAASINTASTLVLRDGSGNFAAGTITAALTGTASNATNLNNQADTFYLARGNHTGSQLASTISNFDTQVRTSRLDQMAVPTASIAMNTQKITGLLDPTSPQDAATKNYVDSISAGLDPKASVRLATTADLAGITYTATAGASARGQITGAPNSVDGVAVVAGNRILVKNQTTGTGAANGFYTVTTVGTGINGVWDRATDFDTDAEATPGAFTFVEEGTANKTTQWILSTIAPITLGGASGTVLVFTQFGAGQVYTAGNGLSLTANAFAVTGTAARITVSGTGVDIASTYVGQASITTLGTITTGTWTGTAIAVANGGTGSTTAAGAKTALGFMSRFAVTFGDGAATSYTITHNLNTLDVLSSIVEVAGGLEVEANVTHATVNTLTLAFTVAPATNALRCTVIG